MKPRIVAFVDHEIGYTLLERLIEGAKNSELHLLAVVTTKENGASWWPSVKQLCVRENVLLHLYSDNLEFTLKDSEVDFFFLLSWKYLLPTSLLKRPICGTINLHYSLLPDLRGVYPVNWAIIEGRKKTGVTYHLVDSVKIDAGYALCQEELEIFYSDTARSLQLRLDNLAASLFEKVLDYARNPRDKLSLLAINPSQNSYKSRADFDKSNALNLDRKYSGLEFLNILRGKSFFANSKCLYFVDPSDGQKIYLHLELSKK